MARGSGTKRLAEYSRKRDFEKTSEPAPRKAKASKGGATFVVHKHDATRLHYDVRLEIDGALASWAVPKGPSLDPKIKRLAVQTEDHPLEYGGFEGRIPDGEYGGGDSLIWDRGTYETEPPGAASEQRDKGHLVVVFHGEKLAGRFHLIRTQRGSGDKRQWLMFKSKDEYASDKEDIVTTRPESVVSGRVVTRGPERRKMLHAMHASPEKLLEKVFPPMLATLVSDPPEGEEAWVYELKYDGIRLLAAKSGDKIAMQSRNALDLAARFPEIADALAEIIVGEAVIDGEVVAFDAKGAPRFQLLQGGVGERAYCAFDLLWLDGKDLRKEPLEARRDLLTSLLANAPESIRLAERVDGDPAERLIEVGGRGFEGLIAKKRGSHYEPGRSRAWLKLKVLGESELAIVGFTPNKTSKKEIGALLLAASDGKKLHFAGKVGTGFSRKQRVDLKDQLEGDKVEATEVVGAPRMREAVWTKPKLVAQVRYTEWTSDDKLRHPAFLGLREDKTPLECVRERPVQAEPEVVLTHPDKVLYPRDGFTKTSLADYYEAVSEPMLRALAGRPLTFEHYRSGVDGKGEFRQNIGRERKPWMTIVSTPARTKEGRVDHLVADSRAALRYLAQHNTLVIHMWSSRTPTLAEPDWCVFDLDPADGAGIEQAIPVAKRLHGLFEELKLPSVVKTSGKRGIHLFIPLAPGHTHERSVDFALALGAAVAKAMPEVTLERAKAQRKGRLYLDCLQNGYGKTIVAPYSPRASDGAPVSTPIEWDEVTAKLDPKRFTIETTPKRLSKVGDLFAPALTNGVELPNLK